jgi:hypothetical protein
MKNRRRGYQRTGSRAEAEYRSLPPHGRLGDAPIEENVHEQMTAVVHALDEVFNGQIGGPGRKIGFVLMVFPFGDQFDRCNFASNGADRRDVVTLMREMIARFEGQPEMKGSA